MLLPMARAQMSIDPKVDPIAGPSPTLCTWSIATQHPPSCEVAIGAAYSVLKSIFQVSSTLLNSQMYTRIDIAIHRANVLLSGYDVIGSFGAHQNDLRKPYCAP